LLSYVDALLDKKTDTVHVVERINGKRIFTSYPADYVFYYDDPKGKYRTIYGTPVSKFSTHRDKIFQKESRIHSNVRKWESDINPVNRCLETNYLGKDAPALNVAFFDIETEFDPLRGFSTTADPFTKITAITVHLSWTDQLITLSLAPDRLSKETAQDIAAKFENCYLFNDEAEMIKVFLDLIEDADVLSGWNSEGYDIPYTVNRTTRVLSKNDTRRFCLWDQFPKPRTFDKFGAEHETYDLIGRLHLDYMNLYRKYTYEERHSYSLDAISEYEINERKIPYEGTLDQLYNRDYEKFLEYNRQDVMLMVKMDRKLKFIDLTNVIAHENTVLLPATNGAVAVTDQAIINEAHALGFIVPDRQRKTDEGAPGAYVAYPKKGIHEYLGVIDINSLYPSAIRALNMGPETIVGQLRPVMTDRLIKERIEAGCSFAEAWEGLFGTLEYTAVMEQKHGVEVTIDWENGTHDSLTAEQTWELIFNSDRPWVLSGNGTIFTYEKQGIIPGLLARWYAERQEMQRKMGEAVDSGDKAAIEYWDKRQLVKKINLNSLYGAILNIHCRFNDKRIGQSVTLSGRLIAQHMDATANEAITGEYDYRGEAIVYGDTDSCVFSAWPVIKDAVASGDMEWNKDTAIELYNLVAAKVNDSWPAFMEQAFHCPRELGSVIKGGLELIGSKGLFITKKRYAILMYMKDKKRLDVGDSPGKLKAMGLDLRRSDTLPIVQTFLKDILMELLKGEPQEKILESIRKFKDEFKQKPAWEKGSPKRVNKLTHYVSEDKKMGKTRMPGHVRAGMNWNSLRAMNSDNYTTKITDGTKCVVCQLKTNALGYTSVAYPTDEAHLPEWFKELPFDEINMEDSNVHQKIVNLLGVLNWDLDKTNGQQDAFSFFFG
jgi:DNA polymerase elongation subunit (family B)